MKTKRVIRPGLWTACHPNGKPFWFDSYSACVRKAGKRGFVRKAREMEGRK
jgi:hypothetical protein